MPEHPLDLGRPTVADVPAVHAIYSDPRVWQHLPSGRHRDEAATRAMVERWIAGWERDGLSSWLVRERAGGVVVGHGGCDRRGQGDGAFWNLGYRFAPGAQGRGHATTVARAGIEAARDVAPALPVVAFLLEHNAASARVADKVGLHLRYSGPDAGNPDPTAVRLVLADRELTTAQLDAARA